jgi:hypothetical protein
MRSTVQSSYLDTSFTGDEMTAPAGENGKDAMDDEDEEEEEEDDDEEAEVNVSEL